MANALLLDDDTVRNLRKLFEQCGIEGLTSFDVGGSASFLSVEQDDALKAFVSTTLLRSTRHVRLWIEKAFSLDFENRSGLIALLKRLGLEYHKPNVIPHMHSDGNQQQTAFVERGRADLWIGLVSQCRTHSIGLFMSATPGDAADENGPAARPG